jgi:hypothetical protein
VIRLIHAVGHYHLVQGARIDPVNSVSTENAMCDQGVDFGSALLLQQLRSARDGIGGVRQIIDQDSSAILDVTDQHHSCVLAVGDLSRAPLLLKLEDSLRAFDCITNLVNQRKGHPQRVRNRSSPLSSSSIRTYNDSLLVVGDVVLNILPEHMAAVQIVDGYVKETLVLGVMQVHGDDMVCACAGEEVCNERTGLGDPLLVPGLALELGHFHGGFLFRDAVGQTIGHAVGQTVREGRVSRLDRLGRIVRLARVDCVASAEMVAVGVAGLGRAAVGAVALLVHLEASKLVLETVDSIRQTDALSLPRVRRLRQAIECIRALSGGLSWHPRKRCAALVVGNIALPRVREEGEHGGDTLSRSSAAGRDGDQKLHQVVVHLAAARLDDKDILAADALLDFNARLTDCELAQQNLRRRHAEIGADGVGKLRVRAPTQHDEVADHGDAVAGGGGLWEDSGR